MKTVLVLGSQKPIARLAIQLLNQRDVRVVELDDEAVDLTYEKTYLPMIKDVNVIISFLGPLDVDLAFEGLFDAIRATNVQIEAFVILSTAGIDNEVVGKLHYQDVDNVREYFNQQRYAIKVVDEAEIPYTVLRPVTMVNQDSTPVTIYDEGQSMPAGTVSRETVAEIAVAAAVDGKYKNQSIGLVQTKTEVNE
ncbi:NAD(P)H-binding protein [Nicoliella lavandulae]|uniref:NAD(P)H-binding protein n=1 Tax=Nicoliella lavandulae TaxID=3082954 RepID=A0ABU8SJH4_9LACO